MKSITIEKGLLDNTARALYKRLDSNRFAHSVASALESAVHKHALEMGPNHFEMAILNEVSTDEGVFDCYMFVVLVFPIHPDNLADTLYSKDESEFKQAYVNSKQFAYIFRRTDGQFQSFEVQPLSPLPISPDTPH